MASSPSEKWAASLEEIKRTYREISDRRTAQANRRALLALLYGKPKEDGYGPALVTPNDLKPSGLVTPNDLKPSEGRRGPVEKSLDDGQEAAEKPKS